MVKIVPYEYYYYANDTDAILDYKTVNNLFYIDSLIEKINLQKAIILLNNNITSSKILDNFSIHNPKKFLLGLRFIVQNSIFLDVLKDYSNIELIFGKIIKSNWLQQGIFFLSIHRELFRWV